MESYSLTQWLLFFFTYCFFGWLWESCFVSLRQRRWVNRGFLHGPLLPIYGFGAISILWATLPVRGSLPLSFLLGMLAATLLEYWTGAAMEALFHVRYWDYSDKPLNFRGHICLGVSLGWGVFSLLLVELIHPPVQGLLLRLPPLLADPLALALTVAATVDAVQSFHAAMDLREVLEQLTESNEDVRRIQMRLEVYAAFAQEDLRELRAQAAQAREELEERLEARAQAQEARRLCRREALERDLRLRRERQLALLQSLSDSLELCRDRLEAAKDLSAAALAERREELAESLERLRRQQSRLRSASDRPYGRSLRILRGNPSAKASQYAEALEELRKLSGTHKGR